MGTRIGWWVAALGLGPACIEGVPRRIVSADVDATLDATSPDGTDTIEDRGPDVEAEGDAKRGEVAVSCVTAEGTPLVCEPTSPCVRATCVPSVGCVEAPVVGGVCVAAEAAPWGACDGVVMTPPDRCDAEGRCIDVPAQAHAPLPQDLVLGSWFVLIQGVHAAGHGTLVGTFELESGGVWNATGVLTPSGPYDASLFPTRRWCMDGDQGVAIDIGPNHARGQVDAAGEVLAASAPLANEAIVGVRATGTAVEVDGTYEMILTMSDEGLPRTWVGPIAFEDGCVIEGSALQTHAPAREPLYLIEGSACLLPAAGGGLGLTLDVDPGGGGVSMRFFGAIGPRGDLVLMAPMVSDERLKFGSLLAVRKSDAAAGVWVGPSAWFVALQQTRRERDAASYEGAPALLTFADDTLVNGLVGDAATLGGRVVTDAYGRFGMPIATTEGDRALSGWLLPGGRVGVLHAVGLPAAWSTPFDVPEVPARSSLGILVRRPQ